MINNLKKAVCLFILSFCFSHFQLFAQVLDTVSVDAVALDKAIVDKRIIFYKENFRGVDSNRYTKYAFLDYHYFSYIDSVMKLRTSSRFDGIRIYFSSYKSMLYSRDTRQVDPHQITIILAPTIKRKGQLNGFPTNKTHPIDALNHGELCLSRCDEETRSRYSGRDTKFDRFAFLSSDSAIAHIFNYDFTYRRTERDIHTASIFIHKGTFFLLRAFLDEPGNERYAGFKIYFLSKRPKSTSSGQNRNLISVYFVPTLLSGASDFSALYNFYATQAANYESGLMELSNIRL